MKKAGFMLAAATVLVFGSMALATPQAEANTGGWFCGGSVAFDAVHDKDHKNVARDSLFGNLVPCVAGAVAGVAHPVAGIGVGLLAREGTRDHRADTSHYPGVLPEEWEPFKGHE